MDADGIHPNAYGFGGTLDAVGLGYGYNRRNLTALQVLDTLRTSVLDTTLPPAP